jgi:hypothetical protein
LTGKKYDRKEPPFYARCALRWWTSAAFWRQPARALKSDHSIRAFAQRSQRLIEVIIATSIGSRDRTSRI